MQGQGSVAPTWSIAVHCVCWPWGYLGVAGQGQPPPEFYPRPPCLSMKQSAMVATCAGVRDSQVKPTCEPRLAAASARPGAY